MTLHDHSYLLVQLSRNTPNEERQNIDHSMFQKEFCILPENVRLILTYLYPKLKAYGNNDALRCQLHVKYSFNITGIIYLP
jgi:hypothetical protein